MNFIAEQQAQFASDFQHLQEPHARNEQIVEQTSETVAPTAESRPIGWLSARKSNHTRSWWRGVILSCVMGLFLAGCASEEEKRWREAEGADSVEGYERYLKDYSRGRFVQEARAKLETAHKQRAIKENTLKAYAELLARYPDPGEDVREVLVPSKTKLDEGAARNRFFVAYDLFKTVIGGISISAHESFLKQYPRGKFAEEVRNHLTRLKVIKINLTLTGEAQGMRNEDVEMCARPVLDKNGFRIATSDDLENPARTLTIMVWGKTRSRAFTSQSDPKDVKQCVTSWRISGQVSLELSGANLGSRNFKNQEVEPQGIPGLSIPYLLTESQCHDSSDALKDALCSYEGFQEAVSELVSESHFKVGDRVQIDVSLGSSPNFRGAPYGTVVEITKWEGMISRIRVRTDDGKEWLRGEWYLRNVSEPEDER